MKNSFITNFISVNLRIVRLFIGLFFTFCLGTAAVFSQTNYSGTIFIAPKTITDNDPTTFKQVTSRGTGTRKLFDRRTNAWNDINVHLFTAEFDDTNHNIEVRVNKEFDLQAASREADKHLRAFGQMPLALREGIETISIHKGNYDFGGGGSDLLIHTGRSEEYIKQGILPETMIHEAAHSVLDDAYKNDENWKSAQNKDSGFISDYAQKNPNREDLAESFLVFLTVKYRPNRIDQKMKDLISRTIPNRIAFFDGLNLKMKPFNKDVSNTSQTNSCAAESALRSKESANPVESVFTLINQSKIPVILYWVNYEGKRVRYAEIKPNSQMEQKTYLTHPWVVTDSSGKCLRAFEAPGNFIIK